MNPQLVPFLEAWASKWARLKPGATPADRREHFEIIALEMRLPAPEDVDAERVHVIDTKAGPVRVRVFRHNSPGPQPALIYMHGGAWMQGSPETHFDITSRIASWNRQTVISIDYAKAPERPFPAAVVQCEAVARWAFNNAGALAIDPARMAIGGDSAGGNLAAAVTLLMRETGPKLLAQLLIYPACDFDMSRPSYSQNANGPIVRTAEMPMVNAMYCPDPKLLNDPRVSPLHASSHAGLPPAFLAIAQFDPLRDSGTAYGEALQRAGVPVEIDTGEGLIHGYLRALEYCSDSVTKLQKMAAWLDQQNKRVA